MRIGFLLNRATGTLPTIDETRWRSVFEMVRSREVRALDLKQVFTAAFDLSNEHTLDFCILSYRDMAIHDFVKLRTLLENEGVQKAAISVRAGRITGTGTVFSPKLPYIDEDFIVMNTARCKELGIRERLANATITSHFENTGGVHAALISFLETIVPYQALHVYSNGSDIQNEYGEFREFAPARFYYSAEHSFLSGNMSATTVQAFQATGEIVFLKRPFVQRIGRWVVNRVKRALSGVNYEIQKKYNDKT